MTVSLLPWIFPMTKVSLVSMCPGPGVVTVLTASRAVLRAEQAAAAEQLGGQAGQVPDLRGRRPPPLHPTSGHHHHP